MIAKKQKLKNLFSSRKSSEILRYYWGKSKKYDTEKLVLKVDFGQKVTPVNVTSYYPLLAMEMLIKAIVWMDKAVFRSNINILYLKKMMYKLERLMNF